ncbi:MAG: hypothetical protein HYS21_11545 [Deltaproteobacteria bacterium]|nr:hypothetical protein [Deltaproteobacteria bacterium]
MNLSITNNKGWRTVSLTTGLSWLMKLLMIVLIPFELYKGEYLFMVVIAFSIVLSLVPSIIQRNYRVTLPFELDLLITLSIFLNTFMGEGLDFYKRIWGWDKALHVYGSAVIALLAFVITYTFHYTRKFRLSIPLIGFFTITFAMAVGGLWEIGEFSVDVLFGKQTQNGLADTMWDMIYDLMGGIIVAIIGMFYVKYSNPETRIKLAKPLGEVFGLGRRIDKIKARIEKAKKELKNK